MAQSASSARYYLPYPRGSRYRVTQGWGGGSQSNSHNESEYTYHAVDFATPSGSAVAAAAPGVVHESYNKGTGWGETVVIRHPWGACTRYAHLSRRLVSAGEAVSQGAIIGKSGATGKATGPHLHFQVQNASNAGSRPNKTIGGWAFVEYPGDMREIYGKNLTSQNGSGSGPTGHIVVAWERANVRDAPNLSSKVVSYVAPGGSYPASCWVKGETVKADGYTNDVWVKLPLKAGGVGYVTAIYLKGGKYANLPADASC